MNRREFVKALTGAVVVATVPLPSIATAKSFPFVLSDIEAIHDLPRQGYVYLRGLATSVDDASWRCTWDVTIDGSRVDDVRAALESDIKEQILVFARNKGWLT